MKKHKLIKSLLFAPLLSIPLVATAACGEKWPQESAANSLLSKFKDAGNFITVTDSKQKAAYSNFIFSTDKNDSTKAPTTNYFLSMIRSSKTKGVASSNETTYTYDGGGTPYLYIFAQLNIQDPDGEQGALKKTYVPIADFNENFTVTVKSDAKKTDAGNVKLTGYTSGDEVNEFKMATADSKVYTGSMLYAASLASINDEDGGFLDYAPTYSKLTSTNPQFVANKTFEDKAAGSLAYASNVVSYTPASAGGVFEREKNNPIMTGATFTFKGLKFNLNLTNGMMTFEAPAVLTIT